MKKLSIIFSFLALLLGLMPLQAQAENYTGATMYTKCNMYVYKNRVDSVNYHVGDLVKINSAVTINDVSDSKVVFTVKETGQKVTYKHHRKSPFSVVQWIERQFGKSQVNLGKFSGADRSGIDNAKLQTGMSKDAAIAAWGYPSFEFTNSTKENSWTYRKSRWDSLVVTFGSNGKISNVQD